MNIFEKEEFTLKELCYYFISNIRKIKFFERSVIHNNILDVCTCYILFSSNNKDYRKYLINARSYPCIIHNNGLEKISIREILQHFDFDFNKLIVRINVEKNDYDVKISWKKIYERFKKIDSNIVFNSMKLDFKLN